MALVIIAIASVATAVAVRPGQVEVDTQAVSGEWEQRSREVTLLASDGRITTTNTSTQANYWYRGLVVFADVTGRDGSTTLTPNLQMQDPVGEGWVTVWTAAAAINSADTTLAYLFYPSGLADAAALYTEGVDMTIARTWRWTMTHSDTGVITYSVGCSLIR